MCMNFALINGMGASSSWQDLKSHTAHDMAPLFLPSATLQTCNPEEGPHPLYSSSHVNSGHIIHATVIM
ncbi:hypothetical protein VNO78_10329 [Psophocarpus tetragonolobus]|uniref:Uncharacterized protein n=1 Tax=Psophocarpus tetragonolobus TaxID=3891 RepID=A0AAN9SKK4_PSOTE